MKKDSILAIRFMLRGNYLYEKRRYCEALLSYNRSLCFAEPETLLPSLCYGKRALVYFDLKEYELCLANIELSIESRVLEEGAVNLDDLKSLCLELIETHKPKPDDDPKNFFKLSFPSNKLLPCLSDCVELREDEKFGRHLISNRDLDVGDIVAITDFSFVFFSRRAVLHHCSNCAKSSMKLSLIPCMGCADAMYCSVECMIKDEKKFHQYACDIDNNPEDKHLQFAPLKIFLQILELFDDNFDEMRRFLHENEKKFTIFDFDMNDKEGTRFEKKMALAALSMTHNMNCAEMGRSHVLSSHHRFILKHPKLRALWMSPHKEYLDNLLCKFLDVDDVKTVVSCFAGLNMNLKIDRESDDLNINSVPKIHDYQTNPVGFVVDPYTSLMNQSCFPNIFTKFVDNKHVWIVIRPVKAGDQLFTYRGPSNKYSLSRVERQELLLEHFGFHCDCDGCENDWPSQMKMRKLSDDEIMGLSLTEFHVNSKVEKLQTKEYVEYANYANKIQAMSVHYPCWDSLYLEREWMFNIYRLARPAKWFVSDRK